jgi:glycosyltransferase involved in cell wall biosynthesis
LKLAEGHGGISIVVPLYNKRNTVARTIESVLAQRDAPFEIVVVDDGSTDGSGEVAAAFGDRVTLLRQANAGPSAARNRGASAARYDNLVFLDADDRLTDGALAAHLRVRAKWPDVRLSFASFDAIENGVVSPVRMADRIGGNSSEDTLWRGGFHPAFVINVPAACFCIHRALLNEVGGYDEQLRCWEITDLAFRLALAGGDIALPSGCIVEVFRDGRNSQFERTRHDGAYIARFAHRLMSEAHRVPECHRPAIDARLRSLLRELARSRDVRAFRSVGTRLRSMRGPGPRAWLLARLAALPEWCVAAVLAVLPGH